MKVRHVTILAVCLAVGMADAQDRGGDKGGHLGMQTEGVTMLYVRNAMPGGGTDRSPVVGEAELGKSFQERLARHAECAKVCIRLFDEDKNGQLDEKESKAARKFLFGLFAAMRYDRNRDWLVVEEEFVKCWQVWVELHEVLY